MFKDYILKILVLTLLLISFISLAACGNSEKDDDYISSDIYETDDLISDNATGETEGTELEEDVFETPDSEDKGGVTATPSNSGTGESSKVNSSSGTSSKDTSSTESEKDESETSSKIGAEVTEDGTIILPPVKLY